MSMFLRNIAKSIDIPMPLAKIVLSYEVLLWLSDLLNRRFLQTALSHFG